MKITCDEVLFCLFLKAPSVWNSIIFMFFGSRVEQYSVAAIITCCASYIEDVKMSLCFNQMIFLKTISISIIYRHQGGATHVII